MSLFSGLNVGLQGILSNQSALQTVGHNLANANTPGFSRQRVDFVTLPPQDFAFGQLGKGVAVGGIRRVVDQSLQIRFQDASSSLGNLRVRQDTLAHIEQVFNELQEVSLSGQFERFFRSLEELSNNPKNIANRAETVSEAQSLVDSINLLGTRLRELRTDLNGTIRSQIADVNRAAVEIAELNGQILSAENAGLEFGDANDLRDRRDLLLRQIAEVVNVKGIETSNGAVNVLIGSNYLVFGRQAFTLSTSESVDEGVSISTPFFETTGVIPEVRSGTLRGTMDARDQILPRFQRDLDELARTFAFEMNRVHSEGMGLQRFDSITSVDRVGIPSVGIGGAPLATPVTVTGTPSDTGVTDPALIGYPDDVFNTLDVLVLTGANAGLRRRVVDFDGATGTLFFDRSFPSPLGGGEQLQITSLPHAIRNGSFDLKIVNELTGKIDTFNIEIDVDHLPSPPPSGDSTLDSVIAEINAEVGTIFPPGTIVAERTADNQLRIRSTASTLRIGFGADSSGFLASIGLNTLFAGTGATTLGLNPIVARDSRFLAASASLEPGDNANARRLADLRNLRVLDGSTATFEEFYQGMVGEVGVQTQEARDRFEHQSLLSTQIENERERVSGVNLDEEAVNLITFQRAFQASARYLSVIDELLATLLNSV